VKHRKIFDQHTQRNSEISLKILAREFRKQIANISYSIKVSGIPRLQELPYCS